MEPSALRSASPPFFGYLAAVAGTGTVALVVQAVLAHPRLVPIPPVFWVLAVLAVIIGDRASTCFTLAIMLIWGPAPAALVHAIAVVGACFRTREARWRAVLRAAQGTLAFIVATLVLAQLPPGPGGLAAALGSIATWLGVDAVLTAVAVALRSGTGWSSALSGTVAAEVRGTGPALLLAPVLVAAVHTTAWLVPLVLAPLYAVNRMVALAADRDRRAVVDPLTGLANRRALEQQVVEQLRTGRRVRGQVPHPVDGADVRLALLLLDLDRFKQINDALGHRVGDRLLIEVGRRLRGVVRTGDVVARLGGDEFALSIAGLRDARAARAQASRVVAALAEPVIVDGLPLEIAGSIGIAVHPDHGRDFATLLRQAEVAMYDAKQRGDAIALYAPESDHNSPERLALLADLRRSLEGPAPGGIALYYQPQVEIATGRVRGLEALLRWRHPERGLIDPEELIRVAEHSPVMRLLTLRVLDEVIAQLAEWGEAAASLRVAANISVRDLQTTEIVDRIAARLEHHRVRPEQLQLEITEGALMADPRRVLATLTRLGQLGVSIALDDFGTGYSSMLHLRRLPLAEVKIDRSFVLGAATDSDDAAIVRSMIELAGALGLRVVAEGVEDERTWRMLAGAGCQLAQGWFCARPMPAGELLPWLARYEATLVREPVTARRSGYPAT
jgi:diguanylate cyclase (GGDEF)-like protein